MRKSSDTTAPGAGQRERQENQWIKLGSRLDLEGMSRLLRAGRSALAGALMTSAGLRENRRMALSLLTYGPVKARPQRCASRPPICQPRAHMSSRSGCWSDTGGATALGTSPCPSGRSSGGPSPSNRSGAAQTPTPARLANLRVCRHLCGQLAVVTDSLVESSVFDLTRALRSRRNRYRLRAGYATLHHNSTLGSRAGDGFASRPFHGSHRGSLHGSLRSSHPARLNRRKAACGLALEGGLSLTCIPSRGFSHSSLWRLTFHGGDARSWSLRDTPPPSASPGLCCASPLR